MAKLPDSSSTNGRRSGGITGTPHALPAHWQITSGYLIGPGADLASATLSNANLTNAYLYHADLLGANLTDADLSYADLSYATFSPGTILYDGQTVAQHGFDAASLQTYLEASSVSAQSASNLTIVPEPASVFLLLTGLLTLARVRLLA